MGRFPAFLMTGALVAHASLAVLASENDRPSNLKTEPRMSDPNDPSSFRFTFRSAMDPVDLRPDPDLFVYLNVLRVDGHSRHALMVENRLGGDLLDRSVGLFATTLSKEQVAALGAALEAIKWNELPDLKGGDISAAALSIDYARGSKIVQRAFNARNWDFMNAISPVMSQTSDLMNLVGTHPARAIHVAVARTASGLRLILRNVGTGPVIVADPRKSDGPGKTHGSVGVARDEDGPQTNTFSPPIPLQPVALAPLGDAPPFVTLASGKSLEVDTVPWTPPKSGSYFSRGKWEDYGGPEIDPKTMMPTVPEPDKIESDARPYRIRGAAFSGVLRFPGKKDR
jgi:hypothetical protein